MIIVATPLDYDLTMNDAIQFVSDTRDNALTLIVAQARYMGADDDELRMLRAMNDDELLTQGYQLIYVDDKNVLTSDPKIDIDAGDAHKFYRD